MPIDQKRLRKLTPKDIRKAAEKLPPGPGTNWYTEVDRYHYPPRRLIFEAANSLRIDEPPLSEGTTTHEAIAVLSHNGFLSHNHKWD